MSIIVTLIVNSVLFLQAEDGIRDLTVTGVQTCALPIYRSADRLLFRRLGPVLIDKTARKEANQKNSDRKNHRRDREKIRRANRTDIMLRNVRAKDCAERSTHGNETIEPLALLDGEEIGHERPENGGVE